MKNFVLCATLLLTACYQSPSEQTSASVQPDQQKSDYDIAIDEYAESNGMTVDAVKKQIADEEAEQSRINSIRQADPNLNWVRIGISTGKFSESMNSGVHRTYSECVERANMSSNECIPIRSLPDSYWNAERK